MNTSRFHRAPWGTPLKLITAAVTLLLASTFVWVAIGPGPSRGLRRSVAMAMGLGACAGPVFMVRGYRVEPGALVVERPGWQTRIPLHGLRVAEPVSLGNGGCLRLFGNGGYWSFTGWYYHSRLGRFRLFANDFRQPVALRFARGVVVLAPEDPEAFLREVREKTGLAANPTADNPAGPGPERNTG